MQVFAPPTLAEFVLRALVCAPFLDSAISKLRNEPGAVAEVRGLGLPLPGLTAPAVIVLQLVAPVMILSGFAVWLGALALAVFTAVATCLAHDWWRFPRSARTDVRRAFFEHVAIIGGLLLIAYADVPWRI
ncbi:MAG: DoxX family protein [Ancalomicrobiaceae bacterium]|nr:DoxX family protein [Ancalomicrobiaceae bacterium]